MDRLGWVERLAPIDLTKHGVSDLKQGEGNRLDGAKSSRLDPKLVQRGHQLKQLFHLWIRFLQSMSLRTCFRVHKSVVNRNTPRQLLFHLKAPLSAYTDKSRRVVPIVAIRRFFDFERFSLCLTRPTPQLPENRPRIKAELPPIIVGSKTAGGSGDDQARFQDTAPDVSIIDRFGHLCRAADSMKPSDQECVVPKSLRHRKKPIRLDWLVSGADLKTPGWPCSAGRSPRRAWLAWRKGTSGGGRGGVRS